jgi:O-antigen ligase
MQGTIELAPAEESLPGRLVRTALALLAAAVVGVAWLAALLRLQGASYKAWVVLLGGVAAVLAAVLTRRPKELLLFGWVFSLTYNRQYYVFESIVGYNGTAGPYVTLSDICLLGLAGLWLYERLRRPPRESERAAPFLPWFLPFAIACFLSVFVASRPDWSLYEMLRVAKMGFVLLYVRHNFGGREWRLVLAALAAAVSFQSAVAIKEVATGRQGVIGASELAERPDYIEHFESGAFTGVRGVGTLAHPPYFACYLLLTLPALAAVAATAPRPRAVPFACAFVLGCGGLAATMSRGPWALACGQISLLLAGLVILRVLPLRRALGILCLGSTVAMIALLPFAGKIADRLTGDLRESIDYRQEGIEASLRAVGERPWLGFGLNNTSLHIGEFLPGMEWALSTEEFATRTLHLRAPVALGNGFLYVAEQTGILGLLGFLVMVTGGLIVGMRSVFRTSGECRAVCLALVVGVLGALAEQFVDTPLWVDPNLFTFVIFLGLLNGAPTACEDSEVAA